MVNSIGGATANIYAMTINGAPADDNERQALSSLTKLTPDDWAVVSASVGRQCGPDENGNMSALQPMIAIQLAQQRESGQLQGPLTSGYLKGISVGQGGDYAKELSHAVDFLDAQQDATASWSGDPRLRHIDVSA